MFELKEHYPEHTEHARSIGYDGVFEAVVKRNPEIKTELRSAINTVIETLDVVAADSIIKTENFTLRTLGVKDRIKGGQKRFVQLQEQEKHYDNFDTIYCELTLASGEQFFVKVFHDILLNEQGEHTDTYRGGGTREMVGNKQAETIISGTAFLNKHFEVIPVHFAYDLHLEKQDANVKVTISAMAPDTKAGQHQVLTEYLKNLKQDTRPEAQANYATILDALEVLQRTLDEKVREGEQYWDKMGVQERSGEPSRIRQAREGDRIIYNPDNAIIDTQTGRIYLYDLGVAYFTD